MPTSMSNGCLILCRTLTSRRFINFTREDLEKRRTKYEEAMRALQPQHKQLSKAQIDAFFERLIVDSEARGSKRCVHHLITKKDTSARPIAEFLVIIESLWSRFAPPQYVAFLLHTSDIKLLAHVGQLLASLKHHTSAHSDLLLFALLQTCRYLVPCAAFAYVIPCAVPDTSLMLPVCTS